MYLVQDEEDESCPAAGSCTDPEQYPANTLCPDWTELTSTIDLRCPPDIGLRGHKSNLQQSPESLKIPSNKKPCSPDDLNNHKGFIEDQNDQIDLSNSSYPHMPRPTSEKSSNEGIMDETASANQGNQIKFDRKEKNKLSSLLSLKLARMKSKDKQPAAKPLQLSKNKVSKAIPVQLSKDKLSAETVLELTKLPLTNHKLSKAILSSLPKPLVANATNKLAPKSITKIDLNETHLNPPITGVDFNNKLPHLPTTKQDKLSTPSSQQLLKLPVTKLVAKCKLPSLPVLELARKTVTLSSRVHNSQVNIYF